MIIDAKGKQCPAPIIMTKKGIKAAAEGEKIEVIIDNDTSCLNLSNFLTEMKIEFSTQISNGETTITFYKGEGVVVRNDSSDEVCAIPEDDTTAITNYAIVIKSENMGVGDVELGSLLMRAFMATVCESELSLPKYVVLYNSGVKLAVEGNDIAIRLKELEDKGVEVIVCGTCADYYNLKQQIPQKNIGNMFKIVEALNKASKIIYP
ncbi:MAG: sulfurtransferase-like selenium metabolism protein YedF [Rikenellaceae bacterium]